MRIYTSASAFPFLLSPWIPYWLVPPGCCRHKKVLVSVTMNDFGSFQLFNFQLLGNERFNSRGSTCLSENKNKRKKKRKKKDEYFVFTKQNLSYIFVVCFVRHAAKSNAPKGDISSHLKEFKTSWRPERQRQCWHKGTFLERSAKIKFTLTVFEN